MSDLAGRYDDFRQRLAAARTKHGLPPKLSKGYRLRLKISLSFQTFHEAVRKSKPTMQEAGRRLEAFGRSARKMEVKEPTFFEELIGFMPYKLDLWRKYYAGQLLDVVRFARELEDRTVLTWDNALIIARDIAPRNRRFFKDWVRYGDDPREVHKAFADTFTAATWRIVLAWYEFMDKVLGGEGLDRWSK